MWWGGRLLSFPPDVMPLTPRIDETQLNVQTPRTEADIDALTSGSSSSAERVTSGGTCASFCTAARPASEPDGQPRPRAADDGGPRSSSSGRSMPTILGIVHYTSRMTSQVLVTRAQAIGSR